MFSASHFSTVNVSTVNISTANVSPANGRSAGDRRQDSSSHREAEGAPRAIGELMAGVLARYGVSVDDVPTEPLPSPRPVLESHLMPFDGVMAVG